MLTAYDATFAHAISHAGIEVILVGDSLGNVIQGHENTVPVQVDEIVYHTECVVRGNQGSFVISDMPYMSYATQERALDNAQRLMQAGAQMVKCEGGAWLADTIRLLTQNNVPVCAHLGLMPQSVHMMGGYRVQGKDEASAQQIIEDARALESAGAQMLVVECIPSMLSAELASLLSIPIIGIGAGPNCDGQVLVLHDLLGITPNSAPKFVKNFLAGHDDVASALTAYLNAVKNQEFPSFEHSY